MHGVGAEPEAGQKAGGTDETPAPCGTADKKAPGKPEKKAEKKAEKKDAPGK